MNLGYLPSVVIDIICNYINFAKDFINSSMILSMPLYEENIKRCGTAKKVLTTKSCVRAFREFCNNPGIPISWLLQPRYKSVWQKDKPCWRVLCKNPNIPCSFFEENFEFIKTIDDNDKLPKEFHKRHGDDGYSDGELDPVLECTGLELLASNHSAVPWNFIKKHIDDFIDFDYLEDICSNPNLPVEAFQVLVDIAIKNDDYLLKLLFSNPNMPMNILEDIYVRYSNNQIVENIVNIIYRNNPNSKIRKYFMELYLSQPEIFKKFLKVPLDLDYIIDGGYITWSEIKRYFKDQNKISDKDLMFKLLVTRHSQAQHDDIPFFEQRDLIKNMIKNGDTMLWRVICTNKSIPKSAVLYCIDDDANLLTIQQWESLCSSYRLPIEYLENNLKLWSNNIMCWYNICRAAKLESDLNFIQQQLLERMSDEKLRYCWIELCKNENLPLKFIEQNIHRLDDHCWESLCARSASSGKDCLEMLNFFEKHFTIRKMKKQHWQNIFYNPSIPWGYMARYVKSILSMISLE